MHETRRSTSNQDPTTQNMRTRQDRLPASPNDDAPGLVHTILPHSCRDTMRSLVPQSPVVSTTRTTSEESHRSLKDLQQEKRQAAIYTWGSLGLFCVGIGTMSTIFAIPSLSGMHLANIALGSIGFGMVAGGVVGCLSSISRQLNHLDPLLKKLERD